MKKLLTALLFVLMTISAQATTYYISYSAGSNSNNGTTTSTPWKSHPYMQTGAGCAGSPHAYTHVNGDRFIFKGGDSWPAACFDMVIATGGSSGSPDYYGVDAAFFTGGAWTRPKFDPNHATPTGNYMIKGFGTSNQTWDNIEIVNQGVAVQAGAFSVGEAFQYANSDTGIILQNMYIHDWNINGALSGDNVEYSAGSIYGNVILLNSEIEDSAGYMTSGPTNVRTGGACQNCEEVGGNQIHDVMAGCFSVNSCHDNTFYNMTGEIQSYTSLHSQIIEDDADQGSMAVYNNIIHDSSGIGVTIYMCPPTWIYNNVIWNTNNVNIMMSGACGPAAGTSYVENNTVDCSNGTACFGTDSKGTLNGTVNLKNNHWITNGSPTSFPSSITTLNQTTNITMSTSTATSQGYTSGNVYQPTSGGDSTVGAGTNLSSSPNCTGNLTALCFDRLGLARGATWDIGAYEFPNGGAASTPTFSPVAGTYVGTQLVTISTSSGGAIICYNTTGSPATNGTSGCSAGTLYSGPVSVSVSSTLYAIAGGTGFADSSVGSAAYTINVAIPSAPKGLNILVN